jgi:WD40 repeat protein/tRNA A-37 threonylcarbamoyl transferase component Bud32
MPIATTTELLDALRRARLLEPYQLAELPALQAQLPEPRALARGLVQRGWLTPYQVNALFQGDGHELLLGSYVLLDKLGEGGMGAVFKARNWKLGRVVAIKVIRKERLANETIIRRFHREIRAAAQLAHPNVVRAYDADEVRGTHFFAMECVEGEDLARIVKRHGPLPAAQACEYVRQAALGLQHAHERGLVHRDVKPHNLLLTKGGVVKVLDLGLARLGEGPDGDAATSMTETGCVMGTADYMAPEQARDSHTADIRSDLYSLGCTLYYLLAGRVPFPGGTVTEKMLRHNMDEPTPLEQLQPDVPAAVAAVVRKLMAKRPEDRYQTPAELAEALAPLAAAAAGTPPAAASEVTADTAGGWSDVAAAGEAGPDAAYARRRAAARRRWLLLNLVGAAVFVGLVGLVLGLVWVLRAPPPAPRPAPGPAVERGGSPLDKLDPASIPAAERFDWQPPELVAVLGEPRGRHWGSATTVAVSRDGKQIATGGADGLIRFWDPLTGRERRTIRAFETGWNGSVAFSPDARRLACNLGRIGFYDLRGPEPVREKAELPCQGKAVRLVFNPDGKRLISVEEGGTLSVWDLTASPPNAWMQLKSYPGARRGVDLSVDGSTLAYFPDDKAARLLDISGPEARELATLPLPEPGFTLALAPDGKRLAVGFRGGKVQLWDVTGKAPAPRGVIDSGRGLTVLRFSPDGKRLAVAYTAIRLWDVGGPEPVGGEPFSASLAATECQDLGFTPDGRILVSAGADSTVRFWDVAGDRPQERNPIDPASFVYFTVHGRLNAAFSPDGKRVATYHPDGNTRWWDLDGPAPTRLGEVPQREPAALTPDGRGLLLRAQDWSISWWDFDANPPREKDRYQMEPWAVGTLWATPDSRTLVAGTAGGEVRVLERSEQKGLVERSRFQAGAGRIHLLEVSPDGRALATVMETEEEVKVWDLTGQKPAPRGTVQQGQLVWRVAFAPDSRLLFVSTNASVTVWDVQGGQPGQPAQRAWTRAEGNTYAAAFSPDSRTLATCEAAGNLLLRDARTGGFVRKVWQLPGGLNWVGYAPDGRHLLTVNGNHTGYILRLAPPPAAEHPPK